MHNTLAALLVVVIAIAQPAAAGSPLGGQEIVTAHQGVFNDQTVNYTATLSEAAISNEDGEPVATISSTAYVSTDAAGAPSRPVIFIWNGGPSAASATLHMAGLGPKRLIVPTDTATLIEPPYEYADSPYALLDIADLVFVDPVETGFSRLLNEDERRYFYSTTGDAQSVADYIGQWLASNGRAGSPVYVLGTSYGSIRAPLVAGILAKTETPPAGVILFSQAANLIEVVQRKHSIVGYAVNMPQIAAIAHFHGKTSFQDRTVYELIDQAYAYFMGDYLKILAAGRAVSDKERRKVAKTLEKYTGLSAAYFLEHDLRITKSEFRQELFKEDGLILTANDARYALSPDAMVSNPPVQGAEDAHKAYMTNVLGAGDLVDQYQAMAPDTGGWDYVGQTAMGGVDMPIGSARSVFVDYDWIKSIAAAFDAKPSFKLMIATGVYDTLTTVGPARLLADDVHLPAEGVFLHEYEGGHSFYSNEAEIKRLSDDLRDFVTR